MTADPAFWNQLAEKYSRQPVTNVEAFERKIEVTKARMNPQSVVLDIGCGTGSLALRLAPSAGQVHGLDLSSEMLRIANAKAQTQLVDNVTFHLGPFDESFAAFPDESLDGVCMYSLLHLLEDRSAAMARVYRLLKPGGFFVSSTLCLGETWVPYGPLLSVMRWLGKAPPVNIITRQTLEEEMRRAGFVDVVQPDVGASAMVAFLVASKPG